MWLMRRKLQEYDDLLEAQKHYVTGTQLTEELNKVEKRQDGRHEENKTRFKAQDDILRDINQNILDLAKSNNGSKPTNNARRRRDD